MRHFAGRALLNRNVFAARTVQINRRGRSRHIERHFVTVSQDGMGIRANLISDIAIGRRAISANDDAINEPFLHDVSGHAVRDQRGGNAQLGEFPGGQARALEKRSRLGDEDGFHLFLFPSGADNAELLSFLEKRRILMLKFGESRLRAVTHLDVDRAGITRVGNALAEWIAQRGRAP